MSRLIRLIRYVVSIVLLLLTVHYALNLRQRYRATLSGLRQVQRADAPQKPSVDDLRHLIRREVMADAFRSGHLPDPLPIPSGDPDQIASDLAKKIAAKNDQSTAALMTALQIAGFGIRIPGGRSVLMPPNGGQGMAFDAFSVSSMAKLYNDGWQISLEDLSLVLGKTVPAFQKVPLNDILADGIVKASNGEQPLRFWARVIVELGKQSPTHYDLAGGKLDPATVQLDSIQTSLIVERLYGDMVSVRKPATAPSAHSSVYRNADRQAYLQPAVFHPTSEFGLLRAAAQEGGSSSPCDLGEIGDNIMDLNGIIKTTEWEKLLDVEKQEGIGGPTGGANAVLAVLRVIWVFANMYVKVTMDPPKPPDAPVRADNNNVLIRTDNTEPGETRTLTAYVWFDIDKSALTNCLRPLLHREKLDFGSLPNGGAAKGVGVAWRLTEGGFPLPGEYHNDPAGLLEARKNALVYFDNGGGAEGSTWNKETGPDGKTSIKVTGNPQPRDLSNTKRKPVVKEFAVAVDVKYKNASEADKMLGELLDVAGPGLGIASGDLLGGLSGAISETIFRMHWNIDGVFTFLVGDWVANGAWTGTITYTHTYDPSFPPNVISNNRTKSTSSSTWKVETESITTLDGTLTDDGLFQLGTVSGHSLNAHTWDSHTETIDDCHSASNIVTYIEDGHGGSSEELTGKSTYSAIVSVNVFTPLNGPAHYTVSVNLAPGEDFSNNGTHKQWGTTTRSGCGESKTDTDSRPPQAITIGLPIPGVSGDIDPKRPDVINGQEETSSPNGDKVVIVWNLRRQ